MSLSALLAPKASAGIGPKGRLPNHRYALMRTKAIEIVEARDKWLWSNRRAAKQLGFRSGGEYAHAYDCLKANGPRIVYHGDWSGVEATIYSRFPGFEDNPKFRRLLVRLGDSRVMPGGRLFGSVT